MSQDHRIVPWAHYWSRLKYESFLHSLAVKTQILVLLPDILPPWSPWVKQVSLLTCEHHSYECQLDATHLATLCADCHCLRTEPQGQAIWPRISLFHEPPAHVSKPMQHSSYPHARFHSKVFSKGRWSLFLSLTNVSRAGYLLFQRPQSSPSSLRYASWGRRERIFSLQPAGLFGSRVQCYGSAGALGPPPWSVPRLGEHSLVPSSFTTRLSLNLPGKCLLASFAAKCPDQFLQPSTDR